MYFICNYNASLFIVLTLLMTTIKSYTILYDSMDNAVATGWSFSKYSTSCSNSYTYSAPSNSASCPNGGYCTRIQNAIMQRTFNGVENLSALQVKYDHSLSVWFSYKYNNHNNWISFYDSNSGNGVTHTFAEPTGAISVTIKFNFGCSAVYIDNVYFMATSASPTDSPSSNPTPAPTTNPTASPTKNPSPSPTSSPSQPPTLSPSQPPTAAPSGSPSHPPTISPSQSPTESPTNIPTTPTDNPSNAPSSNPSYSPSFAPSQNPSAAPSYSPSAAPVYIEDFEYGICVDLASHVEILYDIAQSECIVHCKSSINCRMINHFAYFKNNDDSRCYIFNETCKISYNLDSFPASTMWFKQILKGTISTCSNYPTAWKDNTGDVCSVYAQIGWCEDGHILPPNTINDLELLTDTTYGLNAADVCCECSNYAGIHLLDNNINLVYQNHKFNDDLLCQWNQSAYNHQQWQNWDNLILYEWCIDTQRRFGLQDQFDCIYLVDNGYDLNMFNEININLCDWELNEDSDYTENYYFMFLFTINSDSNVLNTYINTQWFQVVYSLFSPLININYSSSYKSCSNEIYVDDNNMNIYGIYPCSVSDTNHPTNAPTGSPTNDPTNDPTIDPTFDPTIDPTNDPTKYPTFDPTFDPTKDPTNDPTIDPIKDPTKHPTFIPTFIPTKHPTFIPTKHPTFNPTKYPTFNPTKGPTSDPSIKSTDSTMIDKISDASQSETILGTISNASLAIILLSIISLLGLTCIVLIILKWKRNDGNNINDINQEIQKQIEFTLQNTHPSAPELENAQKEEEEIANYCLLCCDNIANMFNYPCGHVTYCSQCAVDAVQQDNRCPSCRTEIECKPIYGGGFSN